MTRPAMTDEQWWEEFKKRYDFIVSQKNLKPFDCIVWSAIFAKGDCETITLDDLKHLPGIKSSKQLTTSLARLVEYGLIEKVDELCWKSATDFDGTGIDDHDE